MAMEQISTVLNKLSQVSTSTYAWHFAAEKTLTNTISECLQGLLERDELHKLLRDAACSLDSIEEQYLYQVSEIDPCSSVACSQQCICGASLFTPNSGYSLSCCC